MLHDDMNEVVHGGGALHLPATRMGSISHSYDVFDRTRGLEAFPQ